MRERHYIVSVAVLALALLSACTREDRPEVLTEGENGVWSPDGSRIAFQRHNGRDYDVGVMDVASGAVTWACADAGESVYPAWTPAGELVYSHCALTQTAYRAMKTKDPDGFNLRLWRKDGTTVRLTEGRTFDSTCTVAADGSLWFVSARNCPRAAFGQSRLWRADSPQGAREAKPVYAPKGEWNCGVASPSVSPDGRFAVWAELRDYWEGWTVMLAKADDPDGAVPLIPHDMVGFSPVWHPDGRHVLLTGFRTGDAGWTVYLVNAETGALSKLAQGQNPSVSPDGRRYLFDDTKTIRVRDFAATDFPRGAVADPGYPTRPEQVVMRLERPQANASGAMPAKAAFGADSVWFARTVVDWDGDASKYQNVFKGGWKTSDLGCQLYFAKGTPHFATRDATGQHLSVSSGRIPRHDRPVTITGIRTPTAIYVSVNGGVPVEHAATAGLVPTTAPTTWRIGDNLNPATKIRFVELGTGWPKGVPAPRTRKDVFR